MGLGGELLEGALKGVGKTARKSSKLVGQTDTLLRKTHSIVPETADLSRVRTPQGGLEEGARNGLYAAEELKRGMDDPTYTPRKLSQGSGNQNIVAGKDTRYLKPEQFDEAVQSAAKQAEQRGDLTSTLRSAESLNNLRVNEDGVPRYTEPVPLENPEIAGRTQGGEGGKQGLTNKGRTKSEVTEFRKRWAEQILGPFKHHHILDMDFLGDALNRADFREILSHLKRHFGIEGGDRSGNIIGMMDEKTNFRRFSAQESILNQLADNPNMPDWTARTLKDASPEQTRILDDLLKSPDSGGKDWAKGTRQVRVNKGYNLEISPAGKKNLVPNQEPWAKPTDPESYGLPRGEKTKRGYEIADTWPDGSPVTDLQKQQAYKDRFKKWNIDRKQVKFDPTEQILSPDHIDIVHAAYNSKAFKIKRNIEKMIDSGEWRTLPPKEAAELIAQVYQIQKNIVINTAKRRLKLIKNHIKNNIGKAQGDVLLSDPYKLREWVLKNKAKAANLGWSKKNPPFNLLKQDPGVITEELQVVFSTELENMINLDKFAESFTSQL
tara:strand:+ start:111 stop:1760 length:1650 start_codon:yes stop_codon:yes gene_type:complete